VLLNGYKVECSNQSQRWTMTLKPKHMPESDFNIIVSGLSDKPADMIRVKQADGDLSEFILEQTDISDNKKSNSALKRLNRELFEQ